MIRWKNATFYTMEQEFQTTDTVLTDQGLVVAIGEEAKHQEADQEVDLKGGFAFPGFVDSHLHIMGYGQKLMRPSARFNKNKEEVLQMVRSLFHKEPLFIHDYYDVGITKTDLDNISKEIPILLRHNDYHSVTVNSVILENIKIEGSSGILTEEEANKALALFEEYTPKERETYLQLAIKQLWKYGVTAGHSDDLHYFGGFHLVLSAYQQVLKRMPFRAHLLIHFQEVDNFVASGLPWLDQDALLQLGAVKLFYDGTISSKTALFSVAYQDGTMGDRMWEKEKFIEEIRKIRSYGLPVAVHVIGDQAASEVLEVLKKYPPKDNQHDRLIHCSFMNEKAFNLAKQLPIFADLQPQFLASDLPWGLKHLTKNPPYVYPWKTFITSHIPMGFGSDAPVEDPNPLIGIYDAEYRISKEDGCVYQEEERLSRYAAIYQYTSGANYATYHKNRGKIAKGQIADFTVFHNDILNVAKEDLKNQSVSFTIVDEKIVYQSQDH